MLECKCILFLFLCFLQSFLLIVPVRFMFCQSHQLICYPEKGCNKFFWIWSNSFPINIMFLRIQLYVKSYHLYVSFVFVEFLLTIATSGTVPEIDENSFVMNSVSFIQHHWLILWQQLPKRVACRLAFLYVFFSIPVYSCKEVNNTATINQPANQFF